MFRPFFILALESDVPERSATFDDFAPARRMMRD